MKTISFYNHKGGVGKTTLTAAIAGELLTKGYKVLLIDVDSQANLTSHICKGETIDIEFADYLYDTNNDITSYIRKTIYDNLYILPSKKLSQKGRLDKWARSEATEFENRDVLIDLISKLSALNIDFVLFDMPPSYSELDKKVILASDEVIPILQLDSYSIDGLSDFMLLLDKLKGKATKPYLKRLIFNFYDKRKSIQKNLLTAIDNLDFKKYLVPSDEKFKKAADDGRLIQSENGLKSTTTEILEKITADIIGE